MDVGQVNVRQQTALIGDFLVERRAGYRRVEHELVEVSLVTDRRFDFLDGCWSNAEQRWIAGMLECEQFRSLPFLDPCDAYVVSF
jgi:hypothetical protein